MGNSNGTAEAHVSRAETDGARHPLALAAAERLIVALDVPSLDKARALVETLDGVVSFFKIGLWLALVPGVDGFITELTRSGKRVFLDTKMLDIDATVEAGVARASERGVSFLTVHAEPHTVIAAARGRKGSPTRILAVTVLTNLTDADLMAGGCWLSARDLVTLRARQAVACGADGIVASAADDPDAIRAEIEAPDLLIVTPGIRPASSPSNDQKRIASPAEAIARGSDYLVVGRPIIKVRDPRAAASAIIAEMEQGGGPMPPDQTKR